MHKNPSSFYTYAKRKKVISNKIGPFTDKNNKVINESIAEQLQKQYCSVWSEPSELYKVQSPSDFFNDSNFNGIAISDYIFTDEDILWSIKKIDGSEGRGIDAIPGILLKELKYELIEPLKYIYQESLKDGDYIWKDIITNPILKPSKKRDKPESYRPISQTTQFGKGMERILLRLFVSHIDSNNLISDSQHGFRKGHSTLSELLQHYQYILNAVSEGDNYDTIYCDMQKAFDRADWGVAAHALKKCGIFGSLGQWVYSFMATRTQTVVANNGHGVSTTQHVHSGVPQGSVLGPFLFLLIVDSLSNIEMNADKGLFADDARIGRRISNIESAISHQLDISKLSNWSKEFNFMFNDSKYQTLRIGKNNENYYNEYIYMTPDFLNL